MPEVIQPGQQLVLKTGIVAALINVPDDFLCGLGPQRVHPERALKGGYDWIQKLLRPKTGLDSILPNLAGSIRTENLLWFFSSQAISNIQADPTRGKVWTSFWQLERILLVFINSVWSAFCLCELRPGENIQPRDMG